MCKKGARANFWSPKSYWLIFDLMNCNLNKPSWWRLAGTMKPFLTVIWTDNDYILCLYVSYLDGVMRTFFLSTGVHEQLKCYVTAILCAGAGQFNRLLMIGYSTCQLVQDLKYHQLCRWLPGLQVTSFWVLSWSFCFFLGFLWSKKSKLDSCEFVS